MFLSISQVANLLAVTEATRIKEIAEVDLMAAEAAATNPRELEACLTSVVSLEWMGVDSRDHLRQRGHTDRMVCPFVISFI